MKLALHDKSFHADDVFAAAILSLIHPKLKIVRTRDKKKIDKADFVADVGSVYDPETNRYDHHQTGGAGKRNNVPYAAAGLIWKHFGMQLVKTKASHEALDKKIFQFIDAIDNGVNLKKDRIRVYDINYVIMSMNPQWNSEVKDFDKNFKIAMKFAKEQLMREIRIVSSNDEADQLVIDAIKNSESNLIIMDKFCPWKKTAIDKSQALYIIYQSSNDDYRCEGVPINMDSFDLRKPLPKEWGGLEKEELQKVSGVSDATFCHKALFICGAKSKEGILKLANLALDRKFD